MKKYSRFIAFALAIVMCLSIAPAAFAAPVAEATIDESKTGALTIYKYDTTNAQKDGKWNQSYVSTGVYDQNVNDTLGGAIRTGDTDDTSDLGNGDTSYGYAIKGVEFTYLRVADIVQYTSSNSGNATNHVEVLYGFDKNSAGDLLDAIGLADGKDRFQGADSMTVSATVDGNTVNMLSDNGSDNAQAPLTVVNTRGFDLPETGDTGTWMFGAIGVALMAGALLVVMIALKKKEQTAQQ